MSKSSLQTYLITLGGVTLTATSANAAIINLNISSISGPNAGVTPGDYTSGNLSALDPGLSGSFQIYNGYYSLHGLDPDWGSYGSSGVAVSGGDASPVRFTIGQSIDGNSSFATSSSVTAFKYGSNEQLDWGSGSYLGFKDDNGNYGWLEVTWNASTDTFEFLSGAYENSGAPILAGSSIPEPADLGLLVAGAGAVYALRRRRQQRQAA